MESSLVSTCDFLYNFLNQDWFKDHVVSMFFLVDRNLLRRVACNMQRCCSGIFRDYRCFGTVARYSTLAPRSDVWTLAMP